jgi:hypothetical protein
MYRAKNPMCHTVFYMSEQRPAPGNTLAWYGPYPTERSANQAKRYLARRKRNIDYVYAVVEFRQTRVAPKLDLRAEFNADYDDLQGGMP